MKTKIIFLSHSSKDEVLAKALYSLMRKFIVDNPMLREYQVFYSPESLKELRRESSEWKKSITEAMKNCESCVALVTPNSIGNRWVNYELGMATGNDKLIVPVGVSGIDYNMVIINEKQILSLDNPDNINHLLELVFPKISNERVDEWAVCPRIAEKIENIKKLAVERCVYLVGSKPSENGEAWSDDKVRDFVMTLSSSLLENDFRLASFPAVEHIGKLVAKCAMDVKPEKYEIAGLYKFDRETEELSKDNMLGRIMWEKTLNEFRKVYLKGKDCMVIIGGGEHTRDEYNVAKDMTGLQIFPIPCFGGFGEQLFNELCRKGNYEGFKHPCYACSRANAKGCPKMSEFIERFGKFEMNFE